MDYYTKQDIKAAIPQVLGFIIFLCLWSWAVSQWDPTETPGGYEIQKIESE